MAISPPKSASSQKTASPLWDVIRCCSIRGASDASIRDVEPNAIPELIAALGVQAVFCNGAAAARLYARYIQPAAGLAAVRLPSTSPGQRGLRAGCAAPRLGCGAGPLAARRGKF